MAATENTEHKFFTFPISMLKNFMYDDLKFVGVPIVATIYFVKMQGECNLTGYKKAVEFLSWYYPSDDGSKRDVTEDDFKRATEKYEKSIEEYRGCVMVSIPTVLYWNVKKHYRQAEEIDTVTFLAYAALRSIAGRKGDAYTNLKMINARMEGFRNIDELNKALDEASEDEESNDHSFKLIFNHEVVSKYLTRRMWAKVMDKLIAEYHVTFIREPGKHCRGYHFKIRADDD